MMKQFLNIVSVLIVLMLGMSNASAGPWGRGRNNQGGPGEARQAQRQDRFDSYQYEQDRRSPENNPGASRHKSTMTPEERRALRQQIHDAGREVYPPHR
jgi:hypothetical protein